MTEAEIKLEARLIALERFACHSHNGMIRILKQMTGLNDNQINDLEAQALEQLRLVPVQGLPPELSDVLADEVFHDLKRLIESAGALRTGQAEI